MTDATRSLSDIVNARRIIDGPEDKFRAISYSKYPWALAHFDEMKANEWDFRQVNLIRDRNQFADLAKGQQTSFRRALAFLSNLDSIQVDNLAANVGQIITDPNVRECIYRQEYEEVIHVKAYSAIIETLFPEDPLSIYDMYLRESRLGDKNDFIIRTSKQVTFDPTPVNKVKAIVSNIALEGVYFYSGFLTFYLIGRATGQMTGSVDQIKYIQRDEVKHLALFLNILNSLRQERPDLFTPELVEEYRQILIDAAKLEESWGNFVIEEGMPGVNPQVYSEFIRHRADFCAKEAGLGVLFGVENPCPWFYTYSSINSSQKNFFETRPMTYSETHPQFKSRRSAHATSPAPFPSTQA